MEFLLFVALIIGLIVWTSNKDKQKAADYQREQNLLQQRNWEWFNFIKGYASVVKTASEKKLLKRMLGDVRSQGLVPWVHDELLDDATTSDKTSKTSSGSVVQPQHVATEAAVQAGSTEYYKDLSTGDATSSRDSKLDNITLLLYFGAFLFIASVGLFVGLAEAGGMLKTVLVLLLALCMYGSGLWLHDNKSSLKPAGYTFVGIGIAVTPLVGVAAYNFLQVQGEAVWFLTSLLCLSLYTHALLKLRKPLLNYVFLFTLVSLFESGVAIIQAPIYYYGWMLALVGILVQLASYRLKLWDDFTESSRVSAQLFIPLAAAVSAVLIPQQGFGQFGVTMILAAAYYGLQALHTQQQEQEMHIAVAHVSALLGITSIIYEISANALATGLAILVLAALQMVAIVSMKPDSAIARNFALITMLSGIGALPLVYVNPQAFLLAVGALFLVSVIVWLHQHSDESYLLGALYWISLPFVYGLYVTDLSAAMIAISVTAALVLHMGAYSLLRRKNNFNSAQLSSLNLHIIAGVITVMLTSPGVALSLFAVLALAMYGLSLADKHTPWAAVSGLVVSLSVVRTFSDPLLYMAVFLSLAYSIVLALRFRSETSRWLSTVLWLLLPIGLGGLTSANIWSPWQYAWAYVLVMACLVISRAIARGAMFTSGKVPLAKYARNASLSYVVGIFMAGSLAGLISLMTDNSRLHTTAIIGALTVTVLITAWFIEKSGEAVALVPFLAQLGLISALRPTGTEHLSGFLLASTGLAAVSYIVSRQFVFAHATDRYITEEAVKVSLLTSFIVPSWVFVAGDSHQAMTFGLAVAGSMLLHYWRTRPQIFQEISVGLIVMALLWSLRIAGVTNPQAFSHIIALTFAGFAYWRYIFKDHANSDNYLYLMLTVATVPLVLQALSGESGGLYGWWLLLQQIFFMIVGMTIRKRFVVLWGLYVSVAAVLYQLRHLGYAALGFLAVVVIGIAIYQLQKYNHSDN